MLRLVLPMLTGVMLADYLPGSVFWSLPFSFVFLLSGLIYYQRVKKINFRNRHIPGIIFLLLFLLLGIGFAKLSAPDLRQSHFVHFSDSALAFQLKLNDAPVGSNQHYRCTAEVTAVLSEQGIRKTTGLISFQFGVDSLSAIPKVDAVLWVNAPADTLTPPLNPGEFDYSAYLIRKGILRRIFAEEENWQIDSLLYTGSFNGWFVKVRERLLASMRYHGLEGREYAVLAALLLGKTTDIDKELMLSYSGAGAVHILAVSGLHVALIYMLLAPLFTKFFPGKKFRHIKAIVPAILLWIYAGITGFSPSVLRAALMFTCFIIADNYQKDNNIYNTIGASVILLLLWSPLIAFETGFQLSYLAVIGIVILQKRILAFYQPANRIMSWAWKLIAVSIAAQIGTLPFTLYYFDQFPVWFLLTNLLVIPLSTVILYCGLASFALLWWPAGAHFAMGLSGFLTRQMNEIMLLIEKLPASVIDHIYLNGVEFVLVFVFIVWFCRWLFWYHAKSLKYALITFAVLLFSSLWFLSIRKKESVICMHSIRKGDAITVTSGRQMRLYADSSLMRNPVARRFHFQTYQTERGVSEIEEIELDSIAGWGKNVVVISERRICLVNTELLLSDSLPDSEFYYFGSWLKGKNNTMKNPERFSGRRVIFSAALSVFTTDKWKSQIPDSSGIYNLRNGAFMIDNSD